MRGWYRAWLPQPVLLVQRQRWLACGAAFLGLLLTEWSARMAFGQSNPWFIAPMAASAVLLFAVPASPLAQPWSVFGGNVVAAFVGVSCAQWIDATWLAAGAACALSIGAMFALRCLHPPAGAVAVTAVLGGPAVRALGYHFVFMPVAFNCACMVVAALAINNLLRHPYPHVAHLPANTHGTADPNPLERVGFTRADLDAAIRDYNELLDVSEDDLEGIFRQVELQAFSRRSGTLRCRDIMSRDIVVALPGMTAGQAWHLLQRHALHSLPVVGEGGVLAGIVTLRDVACDPDAPSPATPLKVSDVMTRQVQVARPAQTMAELVPLFSDEGFHHLPVVDDDRRVVGMVTQTDILALLFRTPV
jgi:CBS domain-containing membrane protein